MSDPAFGMGGFFQGMFGDLLKMVKTDQPIQWELVQQFAQNVASDGASEANADPMERIGLEQLLGIASLHVGDVTGMTVTPDAKALRIVATTRSDWARRSLETWRGLIEAIAAELQPLQKGSVTEESALEPGEDDDRDLSQFIAQWMTAVGPTMISMQIGSVIGHLAQRTLSQYELLLPRSPADEIVIVPGNIGSFAEDWSLSFQDLALWLIVRDVTISSVFSRPHVAKRLTELLIRHASGFQPDPAALESRLGDAGLSDLSELSKLMGDPTGLRELTETPELARVRSELETLSTAIEGYAQWVCASVVERVAGNASKLIEALRRRYVEQGTEERTADLLFGLPADQRALDRGEAFIRGIVTRNGEAELARLWVVEANLPTPAEVDAPGLWIERVNLPSD